LAEFNRTLWLAHLAKAGKDVSQYDKILDNCGVDYSSHIEGKEKSIVVNKYNANDVKEGDLADSDFTEGNKANFEIIIDPDSGGTKFSIGFLKDPFSLRASNINFLKEHAKSKAPGFKKATANAVIKQIVNGTKDAHRVKLTDTAKNVITLDDFISADAILNDLDIELEHRYAVIPAVKEAQLYDIDKFISVDKMGKTSLPSGVIGKILTFNIIVAKTPLVSTTGKISATASNNKYASILFGHKFATGFAVDPFTNLTEAADPKTGKTRMAAMKRGGTATAYDTHTMVVYENVIS
jgi:hypothetical protein